MKEEELRYTEEFSGKRQRVRPLTAFLSRVGLVGLAVLCFVAAAGICLLIPSGMGIRASLS